MFRAQESKEEQKLSLEMIFYKVEKRDFFGKKCRIGWIFRSELRVATHMYESSRFLIVAHMFETTDFPRILKVENRCFR